MPFIGPYKFVGFFSFFFFLFEKFVGFLESGKLLLRVQERTPARFRGFKTVVRFRCRYLGQSGNRMAFSCSNFGLYNSTYFHGDGCTGINFSSGQSRKGGVEVSGFGFLKTTTFRASFGVERSAGGVCSKKRKGSSEIRSELQHPHEADSTDTRITIPQEGGDASLKKEACVLKSNYHPNLDFGNGGMDPPDGSGGNGKFPPGGRGGDGGRNDGDHEKNNREDDEFGPILKFNEVIGEAEKQGVSLPSDMLEDAKTVGIQKVLLLRYLELQASAWPLGFAMKSCSLLRNRMLADPSFLFKVGTEIIIDSCCATFAEVQKRGKDFWAEFELYAADLVVGIVVNVALVGMLAPYARIGQPSASEGYFGCITRAYGALPSSVFEAERPGCRFSVQQRFGTYFYKGLLYGSVGFACGIIGQGIANLIMTAKRSVKKSEEDIPVPPLVKSAALWGVFLAVSSNTRYQIINGLERLVEASPLARRVPPVAMAFTVGVRFANNIYGGMQFVDWARWSGVQGREVGSRSEHKQTLVSE